MGVALGLVIAGAVFENRDSFTKGFHQTMVFCSFFAFAAALVAIFTVINKQLHESALTDILDEDRAAVPVPDPTG